MFKKNTVCICSYSKYMENMKLGKKINSFEKNNNVIKYEGPRSINNIVDFINNYG